MKHKLCSRKCFINKYVDCFQILLLIFDIPQYIASHILHVTQSWLNSWVVIFIFIVQFLFVGTPRKSLLLFSSKKEALFPPRNKKPTQGQSPSSSKAGCLLQGSIYYLENITHYTQGTRLLSSVCTSFSCLFLCTLRDSQIYTYFRSEWLVVAVLYNFLFSDVCRVSDSYGLG